MKQLRVWTIPMLLLVAAGQAPAQSVEERLRILELRVQALENGARESGHDRSDVLTVPVDRYCGIACDSIAASVCYELGFRQGFAARTVMRGEDPYLSAVTCFDRQPR